MLKETEWITINNILLELYTIDELDIFAQKSMRLIRMLIPYTKGWFVLFDEDQNIIGEKSYFTGFDSTTEENYKNIYHDQDYIHYLYEFSSETNVYKDSNILDADVRTGTDFYRNFLIPEDIIYGCGILIIRNRRLTGAFNLFRNERSGDFSDKEIYVLNILKKHIENMLYNVTQIKKTSMPVNRIIEEFSEKYSLTAREIDVLNLLNLGYSNQEIADKLIISLSTVKKHVYNLYSKTGAASRSQLINQIFR